MPKSKRRHRKKSTKSSRTVDWSGATKQSSALGGWILIGVIGAAILGGGGYIWHNAQADQAFQELAAKGKGTLGKVENLPNLGRNHLNAGQSYQYASAYPTSGPHAQFWTNPGFYTAPQPATMRVHAQEHGHVIIYYDKTSPENVEKIKEWSSIYRGNWSGVLAVPDGSLNKQIILTAWRKRLKLKEFDATVAAAFIDAYRGRGPERLVR
ncbi:MAG: DUF3105 domain-containing protein [Rhodospirillales bacterium]